MPRFYFHLVNDIDVPDDEGAEFPDLEAAQKFAIDQARALAAESVKEQGRIVLDHRIIIQDGDGAELATIWFRDAVAIQTEKSAADLP